MYLVGAARTKLNTLVQIILYYSKQEIIGKPIWSPQNRSRNNLTYIVKCLCTVYQFDVKTYQNILRTAVIMGYVTIGIKVWCRGEISSHLKTNIQIAYLVHICTYYIKCRMYDKWPAGPLSAMTTQHDYSGQLTASTNAFIFFLSQRASLYL